MSAANLLTRLPDRVRDVFYLVILVAGVGLGSVQVAVSALDVAQPDWLVVALAVYAYLGGVFGITASQNLTSKQAVEPDPVAEAYPLGDSDTPASDIPGDPVAYGDSTPGEHRRED